MNLLTRFCLAVFSSLVLSGLAFAQDRERFITTYDRDRNISTVKMLPVKVSGDKDRYHSLHIAPSYSFSGRQATIPDNIDVELQTVVKGKLRVDLYVVFIVDGETVFLSSNRWGVKRPVPERRWMGERLVFRMPYETFLKMAAAKEVAIKLDAVRFDFGEEPIQAIRDFAKHIEVSGEAND